nr:hypothetical protein CFP56_42179 [Quercus suber]
MVNGRGGCPLATASSASQGISRGRGGIWCPKITVVDQSCWGEAVDGRGRVEQWMGGWMDGWIARSVGQGVRCRKVQRRRRSEAEPESDEEDDGGQMRVKRRKGEDDDDDDDDEIAGKDSRCDGGSSRRAEQKQNHTVNRNQMREKRKRVQPGERESRTER